MTLFKLSFLVLALLYFFTVYSRPTGKLSYSEYVNPVLSLAKFFIRLRSLFHGVLTLFTDSKCATLLFLHFFLNFVVTSCPPA